MARTDVFDPASPDAILRLARSKMGMGGKVYYAPSIPPAKEAAARHAHALHLSPSEPVLALYDGTVFGGAQEGFVVTAKRLCWKNLLEHPRQIEWDAIEATSVTAQSGDVLIAGGAVAMGGELVAGARAFFAQMAVQCRTADLGPYRGSDAVPGAAPELAMQLDRIVALARLHVGELSDVYYHPSIPPLKAAKARAAHTAHLPEDEVIAVLYDDTVFGSAEEGFLLTSHGLCWKSFGEDARSLAWNAIETDRVTANGSFVLVMEGSIQLTAKNGLVEPVASLLRAIVEEARSREGS